MGNENIPGEFPVMQSLVHISLMGLLSSDFDRG